MKEPKIILLLVCFLLAVCFLGIKFFNYSSNRETKNANYSLTKNSYIFVNEIGIKNI
jgi:heme/copper-type cytochrome/quinol oxidase subunit 3